MPILGIVASSISGNLWPTSSYESIATSTSLSGTATFSSIPSTYKHLQIRGIVRAVTDYGLYFQFNGDSSNSYSNHALSGNGSTVSAGGAANSGSVFSGYVQLGSGAPSGDFGVFVMDIMDYASTTKNKTVRYFTGKDVNGVGGSVQIESGAWYNTSAINSITIRNFDTWVSGTQFALYGIK